MLISILAKSGSGVVFLNPALCRLQSIQGVHKLQMSLLAAPMCVRTYYFPDGHYHAARSCYMLLLFRDYANLVLVLK